LGIQLQEPEDGETAGAGFRVTRLIRGAPGDACGLICEGDVLVAALPQRARIPGRIPEQCLSKRKTLAGRKAKSNHPEMIYNVMTYDIRRTFHLLL